MDRILMCSEDSAKAVWPRDLLERASLDGVITRKADIIGCPEKYKNVKYIFSTWGMEEFTAEEIKKCLPSLKAVFYAAGTVKYFAEPFIENGVKVFSAWQANAVPVAEFTAAQIILAGKGYFRTVRELREGKSRNDVYSVFKEYKGNYDTTIGIIGCGAIGTLVCKKLREYNLKTIVFDPFLSDDRAAELGTEKVSLEEVFMRSEIVSNHLANNPQTVGMINGTHFESMMKNATFINTGRGAQIKEDEMADVLKKRPDITVLLDVTDPEPPSEDSPLTTLPNVFLSPHIAGSSGLECHRMAEYMVHELEKYEKGETLTMLVTKEMLKTMA